MFLKRIILRMYYDEKLSRKGENDLIIGIGISSEFSIEFSITNLVISDGTFMLYVLAATFTLIFSQIR